MFALSSARSLLASCRPSTSILNNVQTRVPSLLNPTNSASRASSQLAPRNVKFIKRHKGILPIPIGGSIKGTTLAFGQWGIRIKGNGARLSAKQLQTVEETIKRKIKVIKGARVWMRVFPDIPVCIKVRVTTTHSCTYAHLLVLYRETKHVWVKERVRSSSGLLGASIQSICRWICLIPLQCCARTSAIRDRWCPHS